MRKTEKRETDALGEQSAPRRSVEAGSIDSDPRQAATQDAARLLYKIYVEYVLMHDKHGSPVPIGWTDHRAQALRVAVSALWGGHHYPHMCRDGHEEVGWRGDGEMCPVCLAKAEGKP